MLRLLSWTSCEKVTSPPDVRMFVPRQESPGSGGLPLPSSLKRKRSVDEHSPNARKLVKTVKDEHGGGGGGEAAPEPISAPHTLMIPKLEHRPFPASLPSPPDAEVEDRTRSRLESVAPPASGHHTPAQVRSMRQTIQSQLSLEILLKHKELRLIDQELAKCQIALEQLRRCKEIPYPATQLSEAVSQGTGPALRHSAATQTRSAQSPAPWGVTEGPYTRHYAKWLLPDPRFDGGEPEMVTRLQAGKGPLKGRSTRGSFADVGPSASTSRSQRSGKLKALPAGYGQPKEKATGPMIIKRKSDGIMVKLVCPDCGRHDFGSAQGFINHCRIGHGRSFASHDAAADACGEPVEYDESGAMIGVEPASTHSSGNVHPLIRSARLMVPPATPPSGHEIESERTEARTPDAAAASEIPKSVDVSPDFKACTLTPHLSALVKSKGLGLNLQDIVSDAKTKIELPESDVDDDDTTDQEHSSSTSSPPAPHALPGRHPHVAGSKLPARPTASPVSSPLINSSRIRSPPANLRGGGVHQYHRDSTGYDRHHSFDMASVDGDRPLPPLVDPSPTSESNQAPSLVDDDEEYEPHSPTSSSGSEASDEGEIDFEVRDDDDDTRPPLPARPEFQPNCAQTAARETSPHVRRPSAIRRQGETREEKHVSFVSPSPAREMSAPRPAGDKKGRKIGGGG